MDRRAFFRRTLQQATRATVRYADARVNESAGHWIRPPFALDELEFLLVCTRCDDCIEACPYGVIFSLAARLGPEVNATPALDLLHKGCHLCEDWPCVMSCRAGALTFGSSATKEPPESGSLAKALVQYPLAKVSIDHSLCLPYQGPECGACADSCPVTGALVWESAKPQINTELCQGCALCREACITEPKAITIATTSYDTATQDSM